MIKVKDVYEAVNRLAPFDTCVEGDSVGLLVGDMNDVITDAAVALDVTTATVRAAASAGCGLLLTHHPAYFGLLSDQPDSSPAYLAKRLGLNIISAHTNLDAADGGVNDCLAHLLSLTNVQKLSDGSDNVPMARIGDIKFSNAKQLAEYAKLKLGTGGVKYTGSDSPISRVAVCGGSGGDFISPAQAAGAQALITGESKHHLRLLAEECGVALIECGHFCTEQPVKSVLESLLNSVGVNAVLLTEHDPAQYI